jgi:hypothetical protein
MKSFLFALMLLVGTVVANAEETVNALSVKLISNKGLMNVSSLDTNATFQSKNIIMHTEELEDSSQHYEDSESRQLNTKKVSEVPVPAALPLIATALGIFGITRRRRTR